MINLSWNSFRLWWNENFTFKGAFVFFIWVAKGIPDLFGRTDFWSKNLGWVWSRIYNHGTLSLTVACALLIWLDHRRVLAQRGPKPHNPNTLKGRTLKIRDDLRQFLSDVGKMPKIQRNPSMGTKDNLQAAWGATLPWTNKIMYGYELKFKEAVYRIHLEYGELNMLPGFSVDVPDHVNSEEQVVKIIDGLNTLAAKLTD